MADTVQYLMEEMLPELEDMQRKKYFSKAEIKAIVKRRQEFEYRLKRKAAIKEDFLRYIEYETKLDELRKHRRKAMSDAGKRTLADFGMTRRIHFIFERATRKFGADLGLWSQWLDFCETSNSARRMSSVAAKALALHPHQPALWVRAAAWEFEHNGNAAAARALMQQGLRMVEGGAALWAAYLSLEMVYVAKLRARREVLGLSNPNEEEPAGALDSGGTAAADGGGGGEADDAVGGAAARMQGAAAAAEAGVGVGGAGAAAAAKAMQPASDSDSDSDGDGDGEGAAQEGEAAPPPLLGGGVGGGGGGGRRPVDAAAADAAVRAVLTGAIARVVARSAVRAAPRDLPTRTALLAAAGRLCSFPGAAGIAAELAEGLERDFSEEPNAWDALARHHCNPRDAAADGAALAAAAAAYQRGHAAMAAAGKAADPRLWQLHCSFLQERLEALLAPQPGGDSAPDEGRVRAAAKAAQQLLKVLRAAGTAGPVDEHLYVTWVEAAQRLRQPQLALKAARAGCVAVPASAALWQARIALEGETGGDGDAAAEQLLSLAKQALAAVPLQEAAGVWLQAVKLGASRGTQLAQLADAMVRALADAARGPVAGGMGAAAAALLEAVWSLEGPEAGRRLFQRLLRVAPAGGGLFKAMAELEQRQARPPGSDTGGAGGTSGADPAGEPAAKRPRPSAPLPQQQQQKQRQRQEGGKRVRAVFEAGVAVYGADDPELWVRYAEWEQLQVGSGSGTVYWRALKALNDPEPFIQLCRARLGL